MSDITQADIDKAVADALESVKAKNTELMDELKAAKAELRKTRDIDPAEVAKLEDEIATLRADAAKAAKDVKAATERADKAEKAYADETAASARMLTDNALNDALASAGVTTPAMLRAVKAMLAGTAQVVTEGDARTVKIGDKALADAIKEWAATDDAKHFITAPDNSGGGASGGRGGGGAKTVTQEAFNSMGAKERSAFMASGGEIAAQAA